ncbi:galactosyl transferase GMA12/MNN10 family protein [Lojkania enalia]|uniref:Galactosyl transferase GMA12/MNN10 family protein n=1 Tax=Lojkania enalia TaxID=147567 RepID=A0A9P4KF94_9PLEO|nr:galactosyl transferase GMA12/MNN10 family protein [Didymosphaeria enalia]
MPRTRLHTLPHLHNHGKSQCIPQINDTLVHHSASLHSTCRKVAPFAERNTRMATVTANFGTKSHYKQALQSHILHALIHGTDFHALCDPLIDDLWNKPYFILSLLMEEMAKPKNERLEWIFWVDGDSFIVDQCRPLSSFLPPEPSLPFASHLPQAQGESEPRKPEHEPNVIVSNDPSGFNDGVFFLRVNQWAVDLFTDILAFRHFKPEVELVFSEQSAMDHVLQHPKFKDHVQLVPQHWFNAYPLDGPKEYELRSDKEAKEMEEFKLRRGDFLVHFAGHNDKEGAMPDWAEYLAVNPTPWGDGRVQRDVSGEVDKWWKNIGY